MQDFTTLRLFLSLFIYFERERKRVCKQGKGRGERIPSRLSSVSAKPEAGLDLTNYEIMT